MLETNDLFLVFICVLMMPITWEEATVTETRVVPYFCHNLEGDFSKLRFNRRDLGGNHLGDVCMVRLSIALFLHYLNINARYTAIAVASFGISYVSRCGQWPGGFARLTPAVLSWISMATYGNI